MEIHANYSRKNGLLAQFNQELFGSPNYEVPERLERCLCAVDDGEEIGAVWFYPEMFGSTASVYLQRIYVGPSQRRSGLGKTLVEKVIEKSSGAKLIRLAAPKSAWAFYKKLGFEFERVFVDDGNKFATMRKRIF